MLKAKENSSFDNLDILLINFSKRWELIYNCLELYLLHKKREFFWLFQKIMRYFFVGFHSLLSASTNLHIIGRNFKFDTSKYAKMQIWAHPLHILIIKKILRKIKWKCHSLYSFWNVNFKANGNWHSKTNKTLQYM